MNKITLITICCLMSSLSKAQETSVEKSLFGAQIGYLGVWANHEAKLSNRITFKTEIGLDKGYVAETLLFTSKKSSFYPFFILEPRYYYNLGRREAASKKVKGNTGNFWGLQMRYSPNLFVVNDKYIDNDREILTISPKYGLRRTLGNHFNLETTVGFGYGYEFNKYPNYPDGGFFSIEATIRVGIHFGAKK
ncbi:DUF3575 domain-containing protein [Pedobacter cryophilus]|uniref:DUF3575 domain-containing protein n=1 Tax=Pedobacter cryophilus TaxID=2571271 RepID=A0A4U1C5L1_9SPHI|nr:DUF3575 domain-containing protein [Pedobacter cryophilus]TKC00669.1 DUF3575 domain-containing protein [Pedobacter cryophilus]